MNLSTKGTTVMGNHHLACKLWVCALCTGFLLPLTGAAQTATDTIGSKVHRLQDVTVKGRRTPPPALAGSPLQQLQRAEWMRLGALDVSDAVRHFSGVSVKDYGGIGGLKTVSVRSLGAAHTAICYDGVAVSDCQSGQVDISRFSLDNVSLLSLSIGQSDGLFLPAKLFASAGTLTIETVRPDFTSHTTQLGARIKTGSFGLFNPSLTVARKLGNRWSLSASGDYLRADGAYPFRLRNGGQLIASKRANSDIESYRAEVNLFAALTPRQNLQAKVYLFDSERGLPGSVVYDNPYAAERLTDRNYFAQLRYENRFSPRMKMQAVAKYNYSWNRDADDRSSGLTDDRFRQTETYLSATLWAEPLKGWSFSLAQDGVYNDLSTTLRNCQYPERFTSLTVVAAHVQTPRLSVTASLLNTYLTETVRTGEAAPDRKRLSPSASVSWKPFDAGLRLRASYKDIFRVPTFNDLYYLLIGNSRLKPENTRQFNFGTTWSGSPCKWLDFLDASADVYYNRVTDKIVAMPTLFVWKMMNVGKVETLGLDVNLSTAFRPCALLKVYLSGTYNWMQAEDVTDRASKVWRNQIAYTPRHSGSGSCTLETPWANLSYQLLYASERYRMAQNTADNRIAPYTDHGLTLSRHFRWGRHGLHVQLDALNLSNKNYEIVRFYPMPGRNYKITLNYQL
ncbi:MAG: TonB-dependent receptor [Bacteroides sp.]